MTYDIKKLARFKEFAPLFIRVPVGIRLIWGTQDNVLSWNQMVEFEHFLSQHGFPFPLLSAVVSVYAQFLCGILFLIGFKTRWAALIMIVNFCIALVTVHRADTFVGAFQAITMLFSSCFLLINGPGKPAFDKASS